MGVVRVAVKIQFYHLTATALEAAVPQLMEKALEADLRVLLWCRDADEIARLDQALWSVKPDSFLAHGTADEAFANAQPILLSLQEQGDNKPDVLAVTHGTMPQDVSRYGRVLDIFNGADDEAVAAARTRWKAYKEAGHALQYFKQKPAGGWELSG